MVRCVAEHFPFGKCSAPTKCTHCLFFCCALFFYFLRCVHFPKENVQHLCFLQSKKHSIFAKSNVRNAKSKKTPNTAFLQGKYFQVEILVNILQSKMYAKIDSNILVFCQAHLSHNIYKEKSDKIKKHFFFTISLLLGYNF